MKQYTISEFEENNRYSEHQEIEDKVNEINIKPKQFLNV